MIKKLSKDELTNYYVNKSMTKQQIADVVGCGPTTILNWMKEYNIPRKSTSEWLKGRIRSDEHRRKISESKKGAKNINFGKRCPVHGKRCWYILPTGEAVSMRSQWEVWYAEYLKDNKTTFEYEPKTFVLSDGRGYTPDFYLTESKTYVEIKGWMTAAHRERIDMFVEEYKEKFILANKVYLESLGIDLKRKWIMNKPLSKCNCCQENYHKSYPQQKYCCVKCRNTAIRTIKSDVTVTSKRKYNGIQNGENNNSSKLNLSQVIFIRQLYDEGKIISEIAKLTGASVGNISNIVHRRSWKNI